MLKDDVVVVGAGPAGLAAACGLLRSGVGVRIIDQADAPATTSRANFLHARGSEVLERLGALGELPERSVRAMSITSYLGGRPVMHIKFGDPQMQTAAPPMVISQAEVEAALRARLAELGGQIEWGTELTGLSQSADGVAATMVSGAKIHADWLIGCDGAGSATRRLAGIGFPGVKLGERFLLADVTLDWDLDRSGTSGWIHPDGMLGVMPMPDGQWRVIAYDPDGLSERPTDIEMLRRLEHILPDRTGRQVRIVDAGWLSTFRVHRRLADTYRRSRVFLAGDAAHTHAPFGGQGMLTGLGDAENLVWKLAAVIGGHARDALLATYESERRPLATDVLRSTSAVTKVNVADRGAVRFLRDRILVPVMNLAWVQRRITYQTSQLWVNYRRGPLAERSLLGPRPRQGDRVAGVSGTQLRGGWGLLSDDPALLDVATRRLGPGVSMLGGGEGDAMLVRPDAHLAWRGSDPGHLDDWLCRALTTGTVR